MKNLFLILLLLLTTGACSNRPSQQGGAQQPGEQEFRGTAGSSHSATFDGPKIRLRVEEIRDNRCPRGAQCITAGAARLILRVDSIGELVLCLGDDCQEFSSVHPFTLEGKEFEIELMEVNPYPGSESVDSEKVAIFKIRRVTS